MTIALEFGGRVITDEQARKLRDELARGAQLYLAAARAGMSERTARDWREGPLPSEARPERTWRTRQDPFADVWPWVESELRRDGELEALTLFEQLQEQHPGRFQEGQVRTLQRHVRRWRALGGPPREVMFGQVIEPGRQAQSDFTSMNEVGVTIAGEPFPHLLYHFQLPYSNWEYAEIAFSETYEALARGFQNGAFTLGGVPSEHRTDNLSAATHDLHEEEGRGFNERYGALMRHYGVTPTTNNPGRGHENGDVEKSHDVLKHRIVQALKMGGSTDFATREAYAAFVEQLVAKRNRARTARLADELPKLRPLPARKLDAFRDMTARVCSGSTVRVAKNTYSVPSQLIGREVSIRMHADLVEVRLGGTVVERMERLRGQERHRVQYRHVIHSLVRKPGAFRAYRYRDELYPRVVFRRAYDALCARFGERGDGEYLKVLHLAAMTSEGDVAAALELLVDAGRVPEIAAVRGLVAEEPPAVPVVHVRAPDLTSYDALLSLAVPA